jgi:3',5'-cyclic AMP phosphodiesterase CpdA
VQKRAVFKNFKGKRLIGGVSWFLNRRSLHQMDVANAIRDSVVAEATDHIAFTGDAVNIAAWSEFLAAAKWMEHLGAPEKMSFVPGNHDAYVHVPWEKGLAHFAPWMKPDRHDVTGDARLFPFVRMRRTVALIGLNSGQPQNFRRASGTLGPQQLRDLRNILAILGQQGFYRVVMLHHPPLPGLCPNRKALTDAQALKAVLAEEGCELVLHGHNHVSMLNWLDTKSGPLPIVGVPSASARGDAKHEAAGWNLYSIRRQQRTWITDMTTFRWSTAKREIEKSSPVTLSPT